MTPHTLLLWNVSTKVVSSHAIFIGAKERVQLPQDWFGTQTLPDFKPKRTRYEFVNYGISSY